MNKFVLIFMLLLGWAQVTFGQSEWIDFSQTYYKIKTETNGIYRLSYTTLSASGMDVDAIDPRNIQIFHRGVEVAIYVHGQEDGQFDAGDYIELVGERNDGSSDVKLYPEPDQMGNPYYNNHSDATAFFLTVSNDQAGKRVANRAINPLANEISAYRTEALQVFSDQYALGQTYSLGIHLGIYDRGQGWSGRAVTRNNNIDVSYRDLGRIMSSSEVVLELGILGRSDAPHEVEIMVGPNTDQLRLVERVGFEAFEIYRLTADLMVSDVGDDGRFVVRARPVGTAGSSDNISLSYAKLTYDKQAGTAPENLAPIWISGGEGKLTFSNEGDQYLAYDITDLYHPVKLDKEESSGTSSFPVGAVSGESKLLIQSERDIIEPNVLEKVRFRNLLARSADYIILSHPSLRQPTSINTDPVKAYAAYRHSAAGGSYDTLIVTAEELYNQFNYGEKSPLGIKEFLRQFSTKYQPKFLLLLGRAYGMYNARNSGGVRYFYRDRPEIFSIQDLVPTFGYPYNDNRFVTGFDPEDPLKKTIGVGRIPARTPEQVNDYLAKVKEKDALGASEAWQKEIVHLSGGLSAFELERYYNFLLGYKSIAESVFFGGNVTTFRKRSNTPVELINISDKINEGASMVTFFGHAGTSTTDIDIGFVSVDELGYDNNGKYPFLLMNGCDAGNAFGGAYTFGEDWILTPDRGASNFLAHASVGVDVYLRRYSESFYRKALADSSMNYKAIGTIKCEVEDYFYKRYGTSAINQAHANQMVMLGDPAVKLFPADKVDYSLDENEVVFQDFNGEAINSLTDSIDLSFVVRNIGRVDLDTVDFKISRTLPDGTVVPFEAEELAPIYYRDTVHFTVPNTGLVSAGDNVFTITVNSQKEVPEMTFANNTIVINKFIESSGTQNLSPLNYAIHQQQQVELIAQVPGKSTEDRVLVMQLDTSPDFNSAWRKESRVTTRNIATWQESIGDKVSGLDSVTFYWRTKFLENREGESAEWTTSSFTYIPDGPEGWIQQEFAQLGENQIENMDLDQEQEQWRYQGTKVDMDVMTFGSRTEGLSYGQVQIELNGTAYNIDMNLRRCTNGSFALMAFDQRSLSPYLVVPLTNFDVLDGKSCGKTPQIIQNIRNSWITGEGQTMLLDYIEGLKEGDYVIIFSVGAVDFENWPDEAFLKMKEIGANEATLRNMQNGEPYILFGRKGMRPGEAQEILADKDAALPADEQVITFHTQMKGFYDQGTVAASRIGPASSWDTFYNHTVPGTSINVEDFVFDVIGVTSEGHEEILFDNIREEELRIQDINAEAYPYLRLKYEVRDSETEVPQQLRKWQVNYTGVPEGVLILQSKEDEFQLQEGEEATVKFEFVNISNYDFTDSLTVDYGLQNKTNNTVKKESFNIPAVKAGERYAFEITFSSLGEAGKNSMNVFANPREYLEQSYKNNVLDLADYFIVEKDDQNPVLDVNFDGAYIMDGDIVSPNVMITALVKDENSTLLKQDTTGMEVYLKRSCEGCTFERISFSNPALKWFEESDNTDFKLEYQPGPLEDGIYTLRVNAVDASGNKAGEKPYEVSFEVINESTITHFYPYPNPFSTSVRFVFTVTGIAPPDQIKIQIMTVTGKVVREILQEELGPIKIGNNISEYAWDGKDEFGDQLANGVYIYRVLVRKDGQFVEHRATAGDKAFKKGYGKMYLLR
ncbi:putative type IX secretion system sortase PorU2 [Echinicola salinicaeni]|uniref:putative type IX secretion system sortase PorU2 n=1 Tax=Echinicola salinicaeni TaxID=2762757 RepID=UPI00164759BC|nr:C25 family cysteine peptidase [Echinicola salinicaeni]